MELLKENSRVFSEAKENKTLMLLKKFCLEVPLNAQSKSSEMSLQINVSLASVMRLKSHFTNLKRNGPLKSVLMKVMNAIAQPQSIMVSLERTFLI